MKLTTRATLMTTSLIAGLAMATPAAAQNTPPSPDIPREAEDVQVAPATSVEDSVTGQGGEIVVTGTLIRNPNIESASPITTIGEAEVELRQTNTAEGLLRDIPGIVPSIGQQVNNGNGGASFVNLRGLGTNRNLVLLDGKRIVPADTVGAVDLNNIPVALLERTDVLTGGASTTYGADAVSGVVNFITKRDFAGIDLSLSNQITERGDGNIVRVDLLVGANMDDGRGNVALGVGYQQADPVFQGEREFSQFNISSTTGNPGGSGTSIPARIFLPDVGGFRQLTPDGQNFRPTGAFDSFNFNPFNIFQTPFERFNIFGQGHYEVSDGIQVYTQGLFSKQTVSTIIAPSGSFGNSLTFAVSNPFLSSAVAQRLFTANGGPAGGFAAARNPATAADEFFVSAPVTRRFVEGGGRRADYTTTLFNYQVGIRGDITENIGFDVFGSYGESENIQRQTNNGLASRLNQAVDVVRLGDGTFACRDQSGGCEPFNIFGPAGTISEAAFGFINAGSTTSTQTSLSQARGIISGDLDFLNLRSPLADEAFGFAIGSEYRKYNAASLSDVAQQTPGEVLGNGGANPDTRGQYDVVEGFAELIAPLVVGRPFFHSLQLELGGRVSDYSTTGTAYTYKIAGSWEPVASLKIRGGYNRATRSPNINELFSPPNTVLDNSDNDFCQGDLPLQNANLRAVCLAQGAPVSTIGSIQPPSAGQVNVTTSGNRNLDVEKADTYTAGVVFQPVFAPGLTISADYYNIKVKSAISQPTVGDVFAACFGSATPDPDVAVDPGAAAATSPACTSIRRNPVTGGIDGDTATTFGLPQPFSNSGTIQSSGVDLIANYRRDFGPVGLNLSFAGNWTDESKFQATPVSTNFSGQVAPRECVGLYSVNCSLNGSPLPEFSFQQRTTLTLDGTSVSLLWRFIDDLRVEGGSAAGFQPQFSSIDEKHYFDLSIRQEVTDDINFVFSAFNLTDKQPPIVGSSIGSTAYNSGNTYPSTYDPLGRRYAIGANLRF